jgi:hypothetical protein
MQTRTRGRPAPRARPPGAAGRAVKYCRSPPRHRSAHTAARRTHSVERTHAHTQAHARTCLPMQLQNHTHAHTKRHAGTEIRACIHTHTCTHTHARRHERNPHTTIVAASSRHTHAHAHSDRPRDAQTHTHTQIHTHTQSNTHTCMHTRTLANRLMPRDMQGIRACTKRSADAFIDLCVDDSKCVGARELVRVRRYASLFAERAEMRARAGTRRSTLECPNAAAA